MEKLRGKIEDSKCGWKNSDDKCGWKIEDSKMRMIKWVWKIANGNVRMIKSWQGEINLDVLLAAVSFWACAEFLLTITIRCQTRFNNPSYSRILIGSCLWSIGGQTHDWRHHYRALASAVLKWRKVLRIRIIFYVTGPKIRYKKVFQRHWTGSRTQKAKDKAVSQF